MLQWTAVTLQSTVLSHLHTVHKFHTATVAYRSAAILPQQLTSSSSTAAVMNNTAHSQSHTWKYIAANVMTWQHNTCTRQSSYTSCTPCCKKGCHQTRGDNIIKYKLIFIFFTAGKRTKFTIKSTYYFPSQFYNVAALPLGNKKF